MKTPICPAYSEEEAAQTFALFYYTIYHAECLMTPIGDTMSPLLQAVYQTIWEVRDDCYAAIYNKIPSLQLAGKTPKEQLSAIARFVAHYPFPASEKVSSCFMKDIASIGMILELVATDWSALRAVALDPGVHSRPCRIPARRWSPCALESSML